MTTNTNADLIAEARGLIAHTKTYNFGMWSADKLAHEVAGKVVDALEAAEQRADLADADLEVEQQKNAGYRSRNDALAAVVEKVRAEVEGESGWFRYRAGRVLDILAAAPADALREHDATLIEGLADEAGSHDGGIEVMLWLQETAHQRREEHGRG